MKKLLGRKRRHAIIRKKVCGTAEKPRLCVFRSNANLSAQLINDLEGKTVFSVSTLAKDVKKNLGYGGNVKAAVLLGEEFAKHAKAKGVERIVFDRAGYRYHGRIKAFAESARKSGLKF
ncbi:MAG: 50S ribosomal protein L18 [Candidatus Omnitrophica bacterium]|nr:50S ribosomal protein L18 [Candidatus Omnitrophota bacterium]